MERVADGNKREVSNKRISLGSFLIVVGVFWILVKMNVIPTLWSDVLISWQMLLIGIGILSFIAGNRTAGIVLMLIGGFFLVDEFTVIPYQLRQIGLPVLLIGVGVALVITHRRHQPPRFDPSTQGMDYFDEFVIFGGKEIFITSKNFIGGKITSIFGGAEYDLRQCSLSENGATIYCVCIFGGSGFKVPPDWSVKNEVNTVFGAYTDKRGISARELSCDPSKTLVIKGFCAFGGVEVKFG